MNQAKKPRVTTWSKDQTCRFVEELQKHPLLYDQSHPFYQHRAHRFAALRIIIANLKPIKPNITAEMISRKLKVLKHQYYKEKRCVENPPENMFDQHGNYQPRLWCYELMKFLDKRRKYPPTQPPAICVKDPEELQTQDSEVNDCITEESNDSNDPFEEIQIQRPDPPKQPSPVKRTPPRNILRNKCLKLVETLSNEVKNTTSAKIRDTVEEKHKTESPTTFLGLMVESELSTVSDDIYHDAKWRIIRILEEATTKEREKRMQKDMRNDFAMTSTTTPTSIPNSVGGPRVKVIDSKFFKIPVSTPVCSQVKIMEINTPNAKN